MSHVYTATDSISSLSQVLCTEGIVAALAFLNRRVEHRCTAIYRLEAMTVRNVYLYDRQGELLPESLGVVPLQDSFCQHVMRDGAFGTSNSTADTRLDGGPFQGVVMAYHGVPLLDDAGQLFGSLCHFDFESRPLSDEEFAFLQQAASAFSAHLQAH